MDADIVDEVTSWETRAFTGGHTGLRELAAEEFSGAVEAADTWLFFLNGNVVGVFDGSVEELADVDGTAYVAPGVALPLLFAMRERGGEQQGQYYSEDTPLSEVDQTLSEANFTGYIELSENVLSGDYYVAYYGGRSLAAAFVGNRAEVVTGEEAFDRAADEVGIYDVISVPIDVTDIPEPDGDTGVAGVVTEAESSAGTDDEPSTSSGAEGPGDDQATEAATDEQDTTSAEPTDTPDAAETPDEPQAGTDDGSSPAEPVGAPEPSNPVEPTDSETGSEDVTEQAERFDEEEEWRETRTIPSLSPSETDPATANDQSNSSTTTAPSNPGSSTSDPRVSELQEALHQRESRLEALEEQLESVAAERDAAISEREELEGELAELREEREQLTDRIERLETELEAAGSGGGEATGTAATDGQSLSRDAALGETNLFVRYGSKGDATLEAVADGMSAEEVNANLQLDHHTQFDANAVTVDGDAFEAFLVGTPEYTFVEWVVRDLPYEIRETGHERELVDLYEAIPRIDRAELHGTVSAQTEQGQVAASYDVVLRGRKGEPLIVASINDSRDPVTGEMMASLVEETSAVESEVPEVATAMSVTASFFKPDALEVAEESTGGGFLSRDARESFVRTSRKQGYHLCLVESRKGSFHVTVPEL